MLARLLRALRPPPVTETGPVPKTPDPAWVKWLHASRPNLPDWAALLSRPGEADFWREAKARAADGPRVLVATSVPGSAAHTMIESIVAVALTLRGANVSLLTCDRVLPACFRTEKPEVPDPATIADYAFNAHRLCQECPNVGYLLYAPLGLPQLEFSEFLAPADHERARSLAQTLPFAEIAGYTQEGLAVGEHALAGALRYFASGNLAHEPAGEVIVRRYFEGALLTAALMARLLEQKKFAAAFFNHGIYAPQGIVAESLRQHGVPISIWHIAYRKSCFLASHGDTYHHTMLTEPTSAWEDLPWDDAREAELMDYLQSRWQGTNDWIWFHEKPEESLEKISAEIGVDLSKPTIGLLTNVMWDAQLHYRANAFPNMLAWVLATVAWFARHPELQLLIRVHPAEVRGTMKSRQPLVAELARHWPQLPPNVFVIPPESQVSTYAAMLQCDSVIIYATKTGVELTALGVPVIVAGEAWIRGKGFALDAGDPAGYERLLATLPLRRRLEGQDLLRAKKYAYHFFFRRMIPIHFIPPAGDWPPYRLDIAGLRDLLPGQDAGLDVLCDGVLKGSPFIYPAELHSPRPPAR